MDKHELKLRASAVVLIHALLALKTVASDQVILTQVEYAQCAVQTGARFLCYTPVTQIHA